MKTHWFLTRLEVVAIAVGINALPIAFCQDAKPAAPGAVAETSKPSPALTLPEQGFQALFTKAYLSGRWAPLKEGVLGEEKSGDKYHVLGVTKGDGENWSINAQLKYRDQEFVVPIPAQVKFAADTIILVVNNLAIPGGGTYSARIFIHEKTYSGTWKGARGGGMLYGTISNE